MTSFSPEVVVLGAGLQGTGVALELARRGIPVTLIERDALAMNRASLRNEGKIHLGLIYANDPSRETAFLQLRGALRFRRTLARWIDPAELVLSTPFHYLVANDSVLSPELLLEHYAAVEHRLGEEMRDDPALDYLGTRPGRLVRPLERDEIEAHFEGARFLAGFATEERAVHTDRLAETLRRAVMRAPGLTFRPSHTVREVSEEGEGFRIGGDGPDGAWILHARQVVNATWEKRLALDQRIGISPPPGLLHRLKYRVIARVPEPMRQAPSVTMVLGRYGDVVVRPDRTAYLSWYPAGLRGWSHDLEPPAEWDAACAGHVPPEQADAIAASIRSGIAAWYPSVGSCEALQVDAGAIVAIGRTDVDDATSGLHDRSRIGVFSRGGYHSVDPGKLTTAPLFALEAADRVEAIARTRQVPRGASSSEAPREAPPLVVALVPTWNAAAFISRTLEALSAQTYPRLEILISDDASTDDTAELCARHAAEDARMRLIRQPRNLGWVGNVNALLAAAHGDYFLFAFQDDLPEPTYVERCVAALEADPGAVIAFSDIALVQQDGRRETRTFELFDGRTSRWERSRRMAGQRGNWWIPNRGVFRSSAAREIGGLRRHAAGEFSADWPWLLHMSLLGSFARVPEMLCTKIYQPRSLSRTWNFGARSWCAVALSASAAVSRAKVPASEKALLQVILARFAWRHVANAIERGLRSRFGATAEPPMRRLDPVRAWSRDEPNLE